MFSLLHFLASHPRNADTLKRALHGDADARRLFSFLGVTPTHLESIDEGAIARRSVAVSVRSGKIRLTAPASCADRLAEAEEAIRVLRDRAESAEASVHELRQRLQAEIMAHDTTRSQVGKAPKPEQTPPEEVIVLGPWRNENGVMRREKLTEPWKGYAFMHAYPATPKGAWSCIRPERAREADGVYHDIGGMPVADDWARDRYALIDAEPGSVVGVLGSWCENWGAKRCDAHQATTDTFIEVALRQWNIGRRRSNGTYERLAHGPQTGEEGKRYALAAAHALGLTGGGE